MTRVDLKNYKYNQQWIQGRLEYIEEYRTHIANITAILSDMPKGSKKTEDSMAEKITQLIDTTNQLLDKIVVENKKQKQILDELNKIEQPYKLILEKVYIQGKTLVTVANEMGYSYERMKHMNGIALNKFDRMEKK